MCPQGNWEYDFDYDVQNAVRIVPYLQNPHPAERVPLPSWNVIPYGAPGQRQDKLLTILDDKYEPGKILKQTLRHLRECPQTQKVVLYVDISDDRWYQEWFGAEPQFSAWEDEGHELLIYFKNE